MKKIMSNTFTSDSGSIEAGEALRDFYMTSQRALNRMLAVQGTSFARTKMMMFINLRGKVRSADMVDGFGFSPRTITEAVDALEKDGLVMREADASDRRVKHISLTAAGLAVLEQSEPVRERFRTELFEVLNDVEKEQLTQLVGRLNERLRELEQIFAEDGKQS
jgi:DNA-binding MarR family transcriptional regulator